MVLEFFSAGSIKPSYIVRVWRQSFDEVVPIISAGVFVLLYFIFFSIYLQESTVKNGETNMKRHLYAILAIVLGNVKNTIIIKPKRKKLFGWRPTEHMEVDFMVFLSQKSQNGK